MMTDMTDIKNLLFDLGGVIMDIRREDCVAAFSRLGLKNANDYFGEYRQRGVFMKLESGEIGPDEFHAELRRALPSGVSDEQIDEALCCFLTGIPRYRLDMLEALGKKFNVALLSNTNKIMWDRTIRTEFEKAGRNREFYFPGGIVTSFEARSMKPDAKIFEYAVEKLGIKPEETVFYDDSQANVDAAARMGFHTVHVVINS